MAKVFLLAHTPSPEKTVAAAAKLCYSSSDIEGLNDSLTDEKAAAFVEMLSEIGHESPIEHASFTFGIEGVSRSLLAQITRHRMASFSVKSQRYVREGSFGYVTPPEIAAEPEAKKLYDEIMAEDQKKYDRIAAILKEKHINARSLKNFFRIRCCNRAQWEIRDVADQMLALVSKAAPELFKNAGPACLNGACSEGKMSCGKAAQVREHFKELKNNG